MLTHKRFFILLVAINILNIPNIFSIQQSLQPIQQVVRQVAQQFTPAQIQQMQADLRNLRTDTDSVQQTVSNAVLTANQSVGLSHSANDKAIEAFNTAKEASRIVREVTVGAERAQALQVHLTQQVQTAAANLEHEHERVSTKFRTDFADDVGKAQKIIEDLLKAQRGLTLEESKDLGIAIENQKWKNIKDILADYKPIIKIGAAIVIVALCLYIIKYGTPALMDYLAKPHVISETSAKGLFGWLKKQKTTDINDLIFSSSLQKQLFDLLSRVQTAKKYDEALPNVLFYGAPGTGKTAFVRSLAYASGLDYALTSGSEFAKITDLNHANNELRSLLNWAKKSKKGLIVFIDEAESLFANRKLATTSKATQDFINTFLSLIPDQSQENVMFIFATNHPFKLDDAVTNRIGTSIEFTLPEASERERILFMYLVKYAQENKEVLVDLDQELIRLLPKYVDGLQGFSPRTIKFIAEEMIIKARRNGSRRLTKDIVQEVIDGAKHSLQKTAQWEKERNEWSGAISVH